ncbi:Protein TANC2 [Fusarium oxysporum f. sp. rapae]|uniref:Protein TANC2 n=1 Tax=Fusarium oxysporum f. sp. rapae TaxID=485398 RepID=A0A8J5NZJ1_FUSOX|nr:Protein TANC2 [Fusarium oxysporum f. sp. rapae]
MEIPNIREGALILSFFFHGRGSELQKTPLGLFRSLLHQLLRQVPEALTGLVATFQQRCENVGRPSEKWQWHPRELRRLFESSLLKVLGTRPVWLFVDALDECGEENAVNLAEYFKSMLQRLPSSGLKQSRICFTCRHYPILNLDGVFEVWVEKENRKDISTFVQDKLSSFRKRTSSTLPDLITEHADGVFLWAWLVVNQVLDLERKGIGLKKIEAEIRSVPQELDTLYRQLIQSMSPDSVKLIQWICFAMRPLSLDELQWAMLVDADCPHQSLYECQTAGDYTSDDERMLRRVQTLSCGLAEVKSDRKVVQFIHQSVKDFFIEKGLPALDENAEAEAIVGIAHYRLSRTCIRYLTMEEIGRSASQKSEMISEFPFLHYATTSWVAHTKQSNARSVSQEDLLEYFAGPSNTLMERWVRIYWILDNVSPDCPPEGTSLVHVMSRYGVAGTLGAILGRTDQVGNINAKDSHGRTPLSWAAGGGHEVVVQVLLKTGKSDVARWPQAVVRLLLLMTGKANIDTKDREGRTPLWWATKKGHEAIVRLLLDRGARTETANIGGQTPLLWAAERGHEAVVRLLLDRGAHTEATDIWRATPLSRAAENGHEAFCLLCRQSKLPPRSPWPSRVTRHCPYRYQE